MKTALTLFLVCMAMVHSGNGYSEPVEEYGFLYWIDGWRGRTSEGNRRLCVQTSRYGALFDVEKATLLRLGKVAAVLPYAEAASQSSEAMCRLSSASLLLTVIAGEQAYSCVGADLSSLTGSESPSRIVECGRFLQRFDIQGLRFAAPEGGLLECTGRLEVVAWPDRLGVILEISDYAGHLPVTLQMTLSAEGKTSVAEQVFAALARDSTASVHLEWRPDKQENPPDGGVLTVSGKEAGTETTLPVSYDAARGWFRMELPAEQFDMASHPDHADQYDLIITNAGSNPVAVPLLFAMDGSFTGITGMTPLLLDKNGIPTGMPVQISKNWHRTAESPQRYEGPWFHGFSVVPVEPGECRHIRLHMVYAHWGGVPAVSHAQLCLIGWGVNQLWDQVAIGSWGETICYDPDINLNRSMIDDIRPLMVHGMGSTPDAPKHWGWTNNVGGADFLTMFNAEGKRLFPSRMRTAYLKYGPNLTEVVYAGVTDDGAVEMRMTVSSPRCDDVARAYHRIRYEVVKPVAFSRLAFYQLGADHYNDHQFERLARGNKKGLIEEWGFQPGGKVYERAGIHCEGEAPWWFSAHHAIPHAPQGGAWANRGLIVREWKARLGGKAVETPYAAFYGTENGIPGMNVELAPPPGLERLEPGDFIEATLELVVVPMVAEEYYGTNENLRTHLKEHANSWQPVYRLARHNDIHVDVQQGVPLRACPLLLKADENQTATFSIRGGAGYVPCTITGVRSPENAVLRDLDDAGNIGDAAVALNRYRQVDWNSRDSCYEVTYTILLDTQDDELTTRRFVFSSSL